MIPEFRELIQVAQKYLNDEVHFSYVCAQTGDFLYYSKQLSDLRIREIAEEWHQKSLQVWDEWGRLREEERITEKEYKEWVKIQLSILNNRFEIPNE